MSNELSVSREPRARKVDLRLLQRATKRALALLDVDYVLGIRLVGSREMARANEAYLSHAGPTDVITFHYEQATVRPSPARSPTNPTRQGSRSVAHTFDVHISSLSPATINKFNHLRLANPYVLG